MRHFGTYGPVNKIDNYVVARSEDLADFIRRIKLGRYIVLFAPRQTGKNHFLPKCPQCTYRGNSQLFSDTTQF